MTWRHKLLSLRQHLPNTNSISFGEETGLVMLSGSLICAFCDAGDVHVLTNPVDDKDHMTNGWDPVLSRCGLLVPTYQLCATKVCGTFAKLFT